MKTQSATTTPPPVAQQTTHTAPLNAPSSPAVKSLQDAQFRQAFLYLEALRSCHTGAYRLTDPSTGAQLINYIGVPRNGICPVLSATANPAVVLACSFNSDDIAAQTSEQRVAALQAEYTDNKPLTDNINTAQYRASFAHCRAIELPMNQAEQAHPQTTSQ